MLRAVAQGGENCRVGTAQPGLDSELAQFVEQRLAVFDVEMRRNLVEQQQRRDTPLGRLQPRFGEDDGDQHRLLLAGRALGSRHVLRQMPRLEVAAVRADCRATAIRVRRPALRQRASELFFRGQRRALAQPGLDVAGDRQRDPRKRPSRRRQRAIQALHHIQSGGRDGDAARGHRVFQRRRPGIVAVALAQQPRPFAQGMFVGRHAAGVRRVEPVDQPVEKTPAGVGALAKQPVHFRR